MWSCLLASALLAAGPQVEIQTFSGQDVGGALAELTSEQVVVDSGGKSVAVSVEDLLAVQFAAPNQSIDRAIEVMLADGTQLIATSYQVADAKAKVKLASGEELAFPTRDLAYVRFQTGQSLNKQWGEILARELSSDRIVIRKDDVLDFLDGVLGTVDDRISFDPGGGEVRVKPEKVFAILYYHKAGRQFPKTLCQVLDATGCKLSAAEMTLNGDKLLIKTGTGLELSRSLDVVRRLDYSQGKIVYLSDLTPATQTATPLFGNPNDELQVFAPKSDRGIDGGPLRLDGRKYAKGMCLHSKIERAYRLKGEFRRFQAVVGIDDSQGERGEATLEIRSRDKVLFSALLTGKDKPRSKAIDLDVSGVQVLTVIVGFGPGRLSAEGDQVDLCNARLIK